MASSNPYAVTQIDGLKPSERRGIVFLVSPENPDLDASETFDNLEQKQERAVRDRFDLWIDGIEHRDNYFHGWPNHPKYKGCFVFKWREGKQNHRLYGFLFHPQPRTRPRFQLCVLISHAIKNEKETDPSEMSQVDKLRSEIEVIRAVKAAFPEPNGGKGK